MEFTLSLILQFFILGAVTLILSGLITFLFPKIPLSVLILLSSMAGYIFTASNQLHGIIITVSILNPLLALTASWIVNYAQFIKRTAERYNDATV
ncbi:hypothetical protein FZC84_07500 [Rossellomorea vietnamensis]|uniref:Integral membrane protein n=1 Tax=Rossellomorea vietnamensis TaxID=218284 RepID=A0A5D4MFT7_9BACI|nr:hypothetical protein [Rossellomorea vietnamensis]TYS00377.1 hypothetical protein FZC84_07500 [Rossellomorea vietnamensis]